MSKLKAFMDKRAKPVLDFTWAISCSDLFRKAYGDQANRRSESLVDEIVKDHYQNTPDEDLVLPPGRQRVVTITCHDDKSNIRVQFMSFDETLAKAAGIGNAIAVYVSFEHEPWGEGR